MRLKLTIVSEREIREHPERFNHSTRDFDFTAVIYPTGFSKWYHLLPFYDQIIKINITRYARILRSIMRSTIITGHILDSHRESTQGLVDLLNGIIHGQQQQPCFVRLEYNSLKDSHKPTVPFQSGEEIVKAILLSLRSKTYIEYQLDIHEDMYVFILPFRFIDRKNELRCFVDRGKLTAITQNTWFEDLKLHTRPVSDFERIVESILLLNERINADKMFSTVYEELQSRVMDVEINPDCSVTLIEFNPFAPCCGSGLFSWERDNQQLFYSFLHRVQESKEKDIEFRIVGRDVCGQVDNDDVGKEVGKWSLGGKKQKRETC